MGVLRARSLHGRRATSEDYASCEDQGLSGNDGVVCEGLYLFWARRYMSELIKTATKIGDRLVPMAATALSRLDLN